MDGLDLISYDLKIRWWFIYTVICFTGSLAPYHGHYKGQIIIIIAKQDLNVKYINYKKSIANYLFIICLTIEVDT